MNLFWVLVIILLLGGVGAAPHWGWHTVGWGPSGGISLLGVILLVLLLTGRL